jgi:essential nuclear protein 1
MPKIPSTARQPAHNVSLAQEYSPTQPLKQKPAKRRKTNEEKPEDAYVDSRASRKILKIGQGLIEEVEAETQPARPAEPNPAFSFDVARADLEDDRAASQWDDEEEAWLDEDGDAEQEDVDPEDLATFSKFNPSFDPSTLLAPNTDEDEGPPTNLTNLILEKIEAHEAQQAAAGNAQPNIIGGGPPEDAVEIPAKAVEAYSQ